MENKYYTPKIEEFHVGFECEFKSYKNDGKGNFMEQWDKRAIGLHTFQENSYEQITCDSNWRVKYLNEQDILNFGFKYTNNNLDLIKITDEKVIRIRLRIIDDMPHLRIYQTDEIFNKEQSFPIFVGKIKNKSEFKKIIEQLEIIT